MKNVAKTPVLIVVALLLLCSCTSVTKFNANLEQPLSVAAMHHDILKTRKSLFRMHPDLDWYVNADSLYQVFDDFKSTIVAPMDRKTFYLQFAPLIAAVKQGHTLIVPQHRKVTKQEKKYRAGSLAPFAQFGTKSEDDIYYIIKDNTVDSHLVVGAEIVQINGKTPQEIAKLFEGIIIGDGYNQTMFDLVKGNRIGTLYERFYGTVDSVILDLRKNDSSFTQVVRRITKADFKEIKDNKEVAMKLAIAIINQDSLLTDSAKVLQIASLQPSHSDSIFRFANNFGGGQYMKELKIVDSQLAILKIKGFTGDIFGYKKNYKKVFKELHDKRIPNLIIDLRGNGGGSLSDIGALQGYLTPYEDYRVINPTSTTLSRYKMPYWNLANVSGWVKPIVFPFSVVKSIGYLFRSKSNGDGSYTYRAKESELRKAKEYNYKGNIYVLVDGGTFSAASIIAANFKSDKRGLIIGVETGGAYNGTVAGQMPMLKLKKSKLIFRVGTINIKPANPQGIHGRGVMPDVEMKTSIKEILDGKDAEVDYVKGLIKKQS